MAWAMLPLQPSWLRSPDLFLIGDFSGKKKRKMEMPETKQVFQTLITIS